MLNDGIDSHEYEIINSSLSGILYFYVFILVYRNSIVICLTNEE